MASELKPAPFKERFFRLSVREMFKMLRGEQTISKPWQRWFERIRAEVTGLLSGTFGEISTKDNTTAMTLNSAAKVQVTIFSVNGHSNNATPDHTNDHITILKAGKYQAIVSISVQNNAAQSHKVEFDLWKNNGATQYTNVHAHRNLSGGSTDVGSMSLSGIIDVSVSDTLEIWGNTGTAGDRSVTVEDITLSIHRVGG